MLDLGGLWGRVFDASLRAEAPRHDLLVGTHHKTGTVWMQKIFRDLAVRLGMEYRARKGASPSNRAENAGSIFFSGHSVFSEDALAGRFSGLHLIRDPRDIIISAAHYHTSAGEPWLRRSDPKLGGLTYQESINQYDDHDRLLFEMEHSGFRTISEIVAWNYDDSRFYNAMYEDLIEDVDLVEFRKILGFLGLSGRPLRVAEDAVRRHSLFATPKTGRRLHIRSGAARQWEKEFTRQHGTRFLELFGDVLVKLKYEPDNSWVDQLGPRQDAERAVAS